MLMMNATKDVCEWFANWPKEDLQANFAFMPAFNRELKDLALLHLVSSGRRSEETRS